MKERMWLRATCAAAVLLAAPGLAGAERLRSGVSGPLKVQTGLDAQNNPVYQSCGDLKLYKTDNGGREWRLEDTCEELLDVFVPIIQPTPAPTPGGQTPGPGTPTPGSAECPDGMMSRLHETQYNLDNVTLQEDKTYTYCFDLPPAQSLFFEANTINKANSSCSDLEMTVVSPHGTEYFSNGRQPGVAGLYTPGRWKIKLHLNWGCNRYYMNVTW